MRKHTESIVRVTLAAGMLLLLVTTDLLTKDRKFSAVENRILASKPKFTIKALLAGDYTADYETYVTDQFVGRDRWISIKTGADIALGKTDAGGVYLAKDGSLIERHPAADVTAEQMQKRLELLRRLTEHYKDDEKIGQIKVMPVPTADNVLTAKLPAYADYFQQETFLKQVRETVGEECYIDVLSVLREHADEYIYYRTDHHWTTLGAYYAYEKWAEEMGVTPVSFAGAARETAAEDFLGTLHSKVNLPVKADEIEAYRSAADGQYQVYYDLAAKAKNSLYEPKHLNTKNKYGYFLDDNHGLIEIQTGIQNGKTLFVIKDSYANCFIPFAAEHYETVCIVDLRYCKIGLYELIDQWAAEGNTDLLVLYNVIHFIEEFQYF